MQILEKDIEKKVCNYAKNKGFLVFKFKSQRGVPDRIFIQSGIIFFIEFKSKFGKIRPLQNKIIRDIRSHNISVFIVNNIKYGFDIIDSYVNKKLMLKRGI